MGSRYSQAENVQPNARASPQKGWYDWEQGGAGILYTVAMMLRS